MATDGRRWRAWWVGHPLRETAGLQQHGHSLGVRVRISYGGGTFSSVCTFNVLSVALARGEVLFSDPLCPIPSLLCTKPLFDIALLVKLLLTPSLYEQRPLSCIS